MARVLRAVFASLLLVLVALPAQAGHRALDNSWTQMDNGNWPAATSDPSCHPCVKWPNYFYNYQWSYGLSKYGFYHTQAVSAIREWNGQPYASPVFDEGPS